MMRRVLLGVAALVAALGCADQMVAPASTDRGALFGQLWSDVDRHYPYLELKHIDWDSLGRVYRPLAVSAPDDHDFATVLGRMLAELRDVHVALMPTGVTGTLRYIGMGDTASANFDPDATGRRYVPGARWTADHRVLYGMALPNVGYVRIPTFAGRDWSADIDEALGALESAAALVLDVRNNPGGTRSIAIDVAGRFADRERAFGFLRFRDGPGHGDFGGYIEETVVPAGHRFPGRVYLLTNRRNTSSAEDLALAMRALPSVTVVGDTTAGATGGPIVRELANGWTYELSQWAEYTLERQAFEGIGLAPDVVVKATAQDARQGTDAALERALGLARSQLPSP